MYRWVLPCSSSSVATISSEARASSSRPPVSSAPASASSPLSFALLSTARGCPLALRRTGARGLDVRGPRRRWVAAFDPRAARRRSGVPVGRGAAPAGTRRLGRRVVVEREDAGGRTVRRGAPAPAFVLHAPQRLVGRLLDDPVGRQLA